MKEYLKEREQMDKLLEALISIGIPEEKAKEQLKALDEIVAEKLAIALAAEYSDEVIDPQLTNNLIAKYGEERYSQLFREIVVEVFDGYILVATKNLIPLKRQKFYEILGG